MKEPNNAAHLALIDKLKLEPNSDLPKGRQLYLKLYESIRRGQPAKNALLPPTRLLAKSLGLGRNTVIQVYDQLVSEGLLEGRGRAGTRVLYAGAVPISTQHTPRLSSRVSSRQDATRPLTFSPGEPDAQLFPQRDWAKALAHAARGERERWGYVRDNGHPELCQSIARFLAQYRGLQVEPSQVVVTAGTRQSLMLAAALYGSPGDIAWVEEPGYRGAVAAWRSQGLNLHACAVDEEGMQLPAGPDPRLIYTTPCFQYPLGVTLSAQRRQALLRRAVACDAVIFEDDYDSEFRDQSQPRPALASESDAAVLHAGTFSKLMFPAVRVAWLVLPKLHVEPACRMLADLGGGHNSVVQCAVAKLLDEGVLARHLNRARQVYAQRRQALLQALDEHANVLNYRDGSGGLSLVVDLIKATPRQALLESLHESGLGAIPLENFDWDERGVRASGNDWCQSMVLGLGNVPTLKIPAAVMQLRQAVEKVSGA